MGWANKKDGVYYEMLNDKEFPKKYFGKHIKKNNTLPLLDSF